MGKNRILFLIIFLGIFLLSGCGQDNHLYLNYNGEITCKNNKTYYIDLDSNGKEDKIVYKHGKIFVNDEDITSSFNDDLKYNINKNKFYIIAGKELIDGEYSRYFYIGLSGKLNKDDEYLSTKLVTKDGDNWTNIGIIKLTPNDWTFNSIEGNEIEENFNAISVTQKSSLFGGCEIYYNYLDFKEVPWSESSTNLLPLALLETNLDDDGNILETSSENFYEVNLSNASYLKLKDNIKNNNSFLIGYSTSFGSKDIEEIYLDTWNNVNIVAISDNYVVIKKEDTGDFYVFKFDGEYFTDGIWIDNDKNYSNINENGNYNKISFDDLFDIVKE